MEQAPKYCFSPENRVAPLGIVALESARELTDKIEAHLLRWAHEAGMDTESFRIQGSCPRFSSGDGKGILSDTVRGYDLYFVVDVGNYSCTYNYFGRENHMSPDDHFQDLKRLIQAASGKAHRINVIMPILYGGRQHRRVGLRLGPAGAADHGGEQRGHLRRPRPQRTKRHPPDGI